MDVCKKVPPDAKALAACPLGGELCVACSNIFYGVKISSRGRSWISTSRRVMDSRLKLPLDYGGQMRRTDGQRHNIA
jgi:hypothetical protein